MGLRIKGISQVAAAAWRPGVEQSEHVRFLAGLQSALRLGAPHRLVSAPQQTGEYSFRVGTLPFPTTDLQFLYGTAEGSAITAAMAGRASKGLPEVHFHHIAVGVAGDPMHMSDRDAIYAEARRLRDEGVNLVPMDDRAIDKTRDPAVVKGADGGLAFFVHPKTTNDRGALGVLVEFNIPGPKHGEAVEGLEAEISDPLVDRVSAVSIASKEPEQGGELFQLLFGVPEPSRFSFNDAAGHPVQVAEYPFGNVSGFRVLSTSAEDSDLGQFLKGSGSRIYGATFWTDSLVRHSYTLCHADWLDPRDVRLGIPHRRSYDLPGGGKRNIVSLNPAHTLGLRFDIEGE